MEEFTSILEAVDSGDLSGFTDEQLAELAAKIREYGQALKPESGTPTDQDIDDAKALAGALKTVEGELTVRTEAAAARQVEADAAFSAFTVPGPDPDDDSDSDEDEPVEVAPVARPSAAEVAKRRPLSALPKAEPKTTAVVASAGEKEDSLGTRFADSEELASAMHSAWNRLANGSQTVARIERKNKYSLTSDPAENFGILQTIMAGSQQARQDGIALTAALGCAPSEPVYDFFNQSSRGAGIVDLPSVTARRGSRTYPPAVGIPDIQNQAGIGSEYTGASKSCYTVACGTTRTTDVVANYTCLTFDNEEGQFYPELVSHYGALSMVAHEHEVNQRLIENMRDAACTTEVHDLDTGGGTVVGLTRALARVRAYYIERHKMGESSILDALIPYWFVAAYGADIAARQSSDYAQTVSNGLGRLFSDLRAHGINAQAVYDWQVGAALGFDDFGSALLYAPGTFVRLDGPTLDLGVVRDSTLNAANDFQTFMESWTGLACVGNEAIYIQGIETCATGETGAAGTLTCGAS